LDMLFGVFLDMWLWVLSTAKLIKLTRYNTRPGEPGPSRYDNHAQNICVDIFAEALLMGARFIHPRIFVGRIFVAAV
jgi:hypothetical protein